MHFKGFMCIRMRKLHYEHQVPAGAQDGCQTVFSFNESKIRFEIFNDKANYRDFLG